MPPTSDFDREFHAFLHEDLPFWIDLISTGKAAHSRSGFSASSNWHQALLKATPEEQTIDQLLKCAKQKLQISCIPHFLKVTMYLRICCLAIQQNMLVEQQMPLGSLYHTLLQWLWECEPDWWEQCTITDSCRIASHNARIQDLLQPLEDFVKQFSEA